MHASAVDLKKAFKCQRSNARQRGIKFNLTFDEWLAVWNESGKLELRGRGVGSYCMSRRGDAGAYELGNVFIQAIEANSRDATQKWNARKDHVGVFDMYPGRKKRYLAKVGKVKLGFYETPELAAAARAAYCAANGLPINGKIKTGTGRGWSYNHSCKAKPYRARCGKRTASFATQEEAEAAYRRIAAEALTLRPL